MEFIDDFATPDGLRLVAKTSQPAQLRYVVKEQRLVIESFRDSKYVHIVKVRDLLQHLLKIKYRDPLLKRVLSKKPLRDSTICGYFDKFAVCDLYICLFHSKGILDQWIVCGDEPSLITRPEFASICLKLLEVVQTGTDIPPNEMWLSDILEKLKRNETQIYQTKFLRLWKRHTEPSHFFVHDSLESADFQNATSFARQVDAIRVRTFGKPRYSKYGPDQTMNFEKIKWKRSIQDTYKDNCYVLHSNNGVHRRRKSQKNPNPNRSQRKYEHKQIIKESLL